MTPTNEPTIIHAESAPTRLSFTATEPVEIQAAAGEGKRPTFAITAYTGAPMYLGGFYSPVIVDLTGLKAASQEIPILRGHDDDRIIGQSDSVKVASDVRITGVVTGDNEDAREVVSQSKNGFKWQASIGASIDRREFLDAGKSTVVNGREVSGPLVIAREATLREVSFVALGADGRTSAVVAATDRDPSEHGDSSMSFEQWLQAKGFDPTALTDGQKTVLRAAHQAERNPPEDSSAPAPTPTPAPPSNPPVTAAQRLEEIMASTRREEERVTRITEITAQAIQDRPTLIDEIETMARTAIEARTAPVEFELNVLRATRATASPMAFARPGDRKASVRVIEASLCLGGGLDSPEKHYDEATLNAASDRFPHGLGLRDLLVMAARENGFTGPTSSDVRGLLRAAFGAGDVRASGFSSLSLPGILSNVANKFLNVGFNAVEDGWRQISTRRSVRDFKAITSYSLTGDMMYEKVGPGGELKHATLGELSYTNRAETYGRMFAITRQDIINDDLGALTDVPRKLGRGAALKLNDVFWAEFLADLVTFFSTGHGNQITGGTSALSATGLANALKTFRKQTDADGHPLGILPRILLVPPELEITADELMTSTQYNTGGAAASEKVPNRNVWAGKYRVVSSSYLSNTSYAGASASAWFLLADPSDLPIIEVAFLNGRETPVVESADADFNTLGIQMRGYHDFGAAKQEYRAGVRAAGS